MIGIFTHRTRFVFGQGCDHARYVGARGTETKRSREVCVEPGGSGRRYQNGVQPWQRPEPPARSGQPAAMTALRMADGAPKTTRTDPKRIIRWLLPGENGTKPPVIPVQ